MKFSFIVTQKELDCYAQLSGDFNTIHQSGLVYGALILAKIEAEISRQVLTIDVQFSRAIFTNQLIEVEIQGNLLTARVKQKKCIFGLIKY
ncbi:MULTISPECIES: hypothetical protein [unclassified Enterococcus]|uniref:hypothetical protein n=1 Tax=unclassified Enterococcus TaxID=2608891 RepID=UPI001553EF2E|nr:MULTISPECIES: hypothetical protein [unclassified Enterococcus]MBS7578263.1 hypothetical protein [Enterococcus sp. MMGLQ5-2]MBS7585443.1 hypothetical protein [Enterococcus sp. MMGLQ5-1]NPD13300.1 hypothetical protein [Enterococcus sp. MMGLQ5-1]NPD38094.1 hypothetical protein [Enterococcus sp. MMGLQ5-2]